jgi:membrane protein implicated in regulation of membrane protease activity
MTWLTEHPALAWLAVALVLAAIEVATLDLIFIMLAVGALVAGLAAGVGAPFVVQVVVAVAVALLLVGLLRPVLLRRLFRHGPDTFTGTAALVGREARVLETVTETGGRIKLRGEVWSARTDGRTPPDTILPGQSVRVVSIEGATAVVTAAGRDPERS